MLRIRTPARCGILGNPSDGFFGKTIAVPARNFNAEVILFEWDQIEILPGPSDNVVFKTLDDLIDDITINGYYGGFRLIKAAIKQFHQHVQKNEIIIPKKNFTIRYTTNIPRQVGLAGSSAIITSTMKALSQFYSVKIDKAIMANLVMWAETKELGISAGLQDRVVQVFDSPVYMDFNEDYMKEHGYGIYTPISPDLFPPMFLAYQDKLTHKDVIHNDVRDRWIKGDKKIIDVMAAIASNAERGFDALKNKDLETFNDCIDKNFDLRASIYPIPEKNLQMVRLARSIGATAKFPGSGGAIIGTFEDEKMFNDLVKKFRDIQCDVIKIKIAR
ncbi:MAG: mevalonate kinase family protein [Promethearchaeota archaeon]